MTQSPMNALVVTNAIGQLKAIDVDGETMQFIIESLGMNDQMLRQLIMDNPESDTKDLLAEKISLSDQARSQINAPKPKPLSDQERAHLDQLNNFIEYWSSDDAMRERMYGVAHDYIVEVVRDLEGDAKQPTWFEVFKTNWDGSTMTIASFDIKQDALAFVLSRPKGLGIDEWTMGSDGIPHQVSERKCTLQPNEYVLYDRGNNSLFSDPYGRIIVYGDRKEAEADCHGNELVISCTQLPSDLRNELLKQINNEQ